MSMTNAEKTAAEQWPAKAMFQMVSIGKICEVTQSTITRVISAAVAVDVVPVMYIDACPFFDEQSVEKIMVHIASSRQASAETAARKGLN
jgi:hypothetical protein